MNVLADKLKSLRGEKQFGVTDLAKLAMVHPALIVKAEDGKFVPSEATLASIAFALGAAPAELEAIARRFRGGKQKGRDKKFGIEDDDFWHYWHRDGKKSSLGRDIASPEEAEIQYADWIGLGCPVPKELTTDLEED